MDPVRNQSQFPANSSQIAAVGRYPNSPDYVRRTHTSLAMEQQQSTTIPSVRVQSLTPREDGARELHHHHQLNPHPQQQPRISSPTIIHQHPNHHSLAMSTTQAATSVTKCLPKDSPICSSTTSNVAAYPKMGDVPRAQPRNKRKLDSLEADISVGVGGGGVGGQFAIQGLRPQPTSTRRNTRERNRVKLVNLGFSTLRQHVPNGAKNKKMSKVETLKSAVEYIRQLQQVLGVVEIGSVVEMPTEVRGAGSCGSDTTKDEGSPYLTHPSSVGSSRNSEFIQEDLDNVNYNGSHEHHAHHQAVSYYEDQSPYSGVEETDSRGNYQQHHQGILNELKCAAGGDAEFMDLSKLFA